MLHKYSSFPMIATSLVAKNLDLMSTKSTVDKGVYRPVGNGLVIQKYVNSAPQMYESAIIQWLDSKSELH